MRQLSKIQNYILVIGAMMMVVGTGCVVFGIAIKATSILFTFGTICFALMQMSQTYEGGNLTIRRLRGLMILGDICLILAGILMLENVYHFFFPYFATSIDGYNNYIKYVYNNWVVALLIGAIMELYTTHRITSELNKEAKERKKIDNE